MIPPEIDPESPAPEEPVEPEPADPEAPTQPEQPAIEPQEPTEAPAESDALTQLEAIRVRQNEIAALLKGLVRDHSADGRARQMVLIDEARSLRERERDLTTDLARSDRERKAV